MKKLISYMVMALACLSMTMVSCKTEEPEGPDKPGIETPTNPQEPDKPAEPVLPKDSTTVYFVNADNWEDVFAYVWLFATDEGVFPWPGEPATKCAEKFNNLDVYSYKYQTDKADMILFHNKIGLQSPNVQVDPNKPYFYNNVWYTSLDEILENIVNMHNGHEYVDLGLSSGTMWATCNLGASTPKDYGDYYAWGETEPNSSDYGINNYKWSLNGDHKNMTKYCTDENLGKLDNKIQLELEDDAAYVNWGGDWRMPTKEQIQELLDECTYERTTQKGVSGVLITSKTNGNSIFMPAGGYRSLFSNYINQHCVYWSSSLNTNDSRRAYLLFSNLEETSLIHNYNRYYGSLIRPVMSKK